MTSIDIIQEIQKRHNDGLILTGLAAIQSPMVQTCQLTFFNPKGGKKGFFIGRHHILIRRTMKKTLTTKDHLIFIARHIELYADEMEQLVAILSDISLKELERHDRAWRIFAYLKKQCIGEAIVPKRSIGRRFVDIGDITSAAVVRDASLYVRDGLLIPTYRSRATVWTPRMSSMPSFAAVDQKRDESELYFKTRKVRPLFHKFCRYASRLESAASAKIEGYDARVEVSALSEKLGRRMKGNVSLRANLNMDNLHRDIVQISREPLTIDFLCKLQKAIVWETWRNKEEMIDKTPGMLRPFGEVVVDRSRAGKDNVVFVAPKHGDVEPLLRELIDFYYRSSGSMHPLDLASLFKCQLVVIHPFGDGNGRLARWCFQSILIREKYLESVHQAPVSHIFWKERNRYYDEIAKVDRCIMNNVGWELEPASGRCRAIYDDLNIYRNLDYSSWLKYVHDVFIRAIDFSIDEHDIFERTRRILEGFEKIQKAQLDPSQEHEIIRAIDIGLRERWGKKTEKRLLNNGLTMDEIDRLGGIVQEFASRI